jgi:carbamoyl-phosphate synthase large subunit
VQPQNGTATSFEEARVVAREVGYPVVVRPSYVLGGRAMEIVYDEETLERYIRDAVKASPEHPILIDKFLEEAIEVDVDAISDGESVVIGGIMEHIEEAGIHSGDSACSLPPRTLPPDVIKEIEDQTRALALELRVIGLMNVQFAVKGSDVYVLEVNPRASRTVPFVAKATGVPIAKCAARVMAGETIAAMGLAGAKTALGMKGHVAVKEAVFPFARFPGVDIILGPEMKSTGEVMGIDADFGHAFAKSQLGSGTRLPLTGTVFISVKDKDKAAIVRPCKRLLEMGFKLIATRGTARYLESQDIEVSVVAKVLEGRPHVVDAIKSGGVQLMFNTTEGAPAIADSFSLRRSALMQNIPYYTTVAGAVAAVEAIATLRSGGLDVAPLQSYFSGSF